MKNIVEEYSGTDAGNQALVYLLKDAYQANNLFSGYSIDPTGSFGSMAFKIVLRSQNSSTPPTVKDLRAIAAT